MIKIIVDNGECTLSWGEGNLFDLAKEVADGACVAIEEMSSRAGTEGVFCELSAGEIPCAWEV